MHNRSRTVTQALNTLGLHNITPPTDQEVTQAMNLLASFPTLQNPQPNSTTNAPTQTPETPRPGMPR